MKRLLGLIVSVMVLVSAGWAQNAPPGSGDAPASKEDIEQLFATNHIRDRVHTQMEAAATQIRKAMHDTMRKKYPDATSKDFDRLDSFFDQVLKDYDFEAIVDEMIPAYQRHLTKADVAAMLAFYNTPTGQKVIKEMPLIMSEATQAAGPRMEKALSEIADQADKMITDAQKPDAPASH
jgi:hypothetical protein